jgi:hypothetical protein
VGLNATVPQEFPRVAAHAAQSADQETAA